MDPNSWTLALVDICPYSNATWSRNPMSKTRRNHAPQFKAKVALEALAGEKTIHEIAAKHQVHPNQVTQWRRQLIDQAASVFGKAAPGVDSAGDREALLAKIGQLTVEKDFLSRVLGK